MSTSIWTPRLVQLAVGAVYLLAITYAWADHQTGHWNLAPFDRIYVQGKANISLQPASIPTVEADGEATLLSGLTVEVMDDVLYIDARHVPEALDLRLRIGVETLREIVFDGQGVVAANKLHCHDLVLEGVGSGAFNLTDLRVRELVIVGTGSSVFRLSGQAQHQTIEIAGNGEYSGEGLRSSISQVSVHGQGDVLLWADELLDVNVFGSAQVKYAGDPRVHRRIFGNGAISHIPHVGVTSL